MTASANQPAYPVRVWLLGAALALPLLFLVRLLWHTQVRRGAEHIEAIQQQSIRPIVVNPVRGRIMAADGTVLVDNRSEFEAVFHVSEMRRPGRRQKTIDYILAQADRLAARIGRPRPLTEKALRTHLYLRPAMPILIFSELTATELALLSELLPPGPGLELRPRTVRHYPHPGLATHALGVTRRERQTTEDTDLGGFRRAYTTPVLCGQSGLEWKHNDALSGRRGACLVRVDPVGYVHEDLGYTCPPQDGHELVLALDLRAQRILQELLEPYRGGGVLLDCRTGAVLALVSSPSYDLSTLTGSGYLHLMEDEENKPLINRAIAYGYTPGSIVKPIVGLAALESGAATADEPVHCDGSFELGNTTIHCWNRSGHGPVALVEAIRDSCNPYFMTMGLRTGLDRLAPMFSAAGIGDAPDLDLSGVGAGLLPSREFARRTWERNWLAIDTAFVSIGQGPILVTPLQAALFAGAIGNGGALMRPFIVKAVHTAQGRVRRRAVPEVVRRLPVRPRHLQLVQEGMRSAVEDRGGTAHRAGNPAIPLAGKTGTAEVITHGRRRKDVWVICYGPVDEPRYAFACMVEDGASGGRTAAPIAGTFFGRWLQVQ